jgi:hypothetical protein
VTKRNSSLFGFGSTGTQQLGSVQLEHSSLFSVQLEDRNLGYLYHKISKTGSVFVLNWHGGCGGRGGGLN